MTVPTVTDPKADGWRVTTAQPSSVISAMGYPPVTGSVVRVTSVVESTTPVAPGPPESTCPTATDPARASRADGVQPWWAAAAPTTSASRLTRPVTTTTAPAANAREMPNAP